MHTTLNIPYRTLSKAFLDLFSCPLRFYIKLFAYIVVSSWIWTQHLFFARKRIKQWHRFALLKEAIFFFFFHIHKLKTKVKTLNPTVKTRWAIHHSSIACLLFIVCVGLPPAHSHGGNIKTGMEWIPWGIESVVLGLLLCRGLAL
jgi:hypothetical protein